MSGKKKLLPLGMSLLLLGALLWQVNGAEVLATLRATDGLLLLVALALFVPQTLLIAFRWKVIAAPLTPLPLVEAGRQILASNALNLLLPSKLGDLAKGVFLHRQGRCSLKQGLHIVVFEKLLDLASLSAWMLIGWIIFPVDQWWAVAMLSLGMILIGAVAMIYGGGHGARVSALLSGRGKAADRIKGLMSSGPEVRRLVRLRGRRGIQLIGLSLAIWALHLLQIYVFFLAVGASVGLLAIFALMPMAIFAGLLPLTIAGVGTRDWAIVAVFAWSAIPASTLAAAGLLVTLRYIVPALGGLLFMGRYFGPAQQAVEAMKGAKLDS